MLYKKVFRLQLKFSVIASHTESKSIIPAATQMNSKNLMLNLDTMVHTL